MATVAQRAAEEQEARKAAAHGPPARDKTRLRRPPSGVSRNREELELALESRRHWTAASPASRPCWRRRRAPTCWRNSATSCRPPPSRPGSRARRNQQTRGRARARRASPSRSATTRRHPRSGGRRRRRLRRRRRPREHDATNPLVDLPHARHECAAFPMPARDDADGLMLARRFCARCYCTLATGPYRTARRGPSIVDIATSRRGGPSATRWSPYRSRRRGASSARGCAGLRLRLPRRSAYCGDRATSANRPDVLRRSRPDVLRRAPNCVDDARWRRARHRGLANDGPRGPAFDADDRRETAVPDGRRDFAGRGRGGRPERREGDVSRLQ